MRAPRLNELHFFPPLRFLKSHLNVSGCKNRVLYQERKRGTHLTSFTFTDCISSRSVGRLVIRMLLMLLMQGDVAAMQILSKLDAEMRCRLIYHLGFRLSYITHAGSPASDRGTLCP